LPAGDGSSEAGIQAIVLRTLALWLLFLDILFHGISGITDSRNCCDEFLWGNTKFLGPVIKFPFLRYMDSISILGMSLL